MKIEYELSKQDYIDFNIYHANNSEVVKKSLLVQRYVTPVIFLILPFLLGRVTEIPLWYWFTVFLVTAVLWVAFYPRYFMAVTMKRVSRMVDEGKNKDLLGKQSIIVDEEGFIRKSQNGENRMNWSGVEKIVSAEKHFFIYVSSISAYVIPKSPFENESDKDRFFEFVSRMLDGKQ